MKKHLWLAAALFFLTPSADAQSAQSQTEPSFVIECINLNFDKYRVLHETVLSDGQFTIETACIPANVLLIKPKNAQATAEGFKQLATLSGIQTVNTRNNLTRAEFEQRCANARSGN